MRYIISVLFLVFSAMFINAQDVNVNINSPSEITAGEPAIIEIVISKGSLNGFARLQQPFPAAINVKAIESAGADFSFSDGKLNIIWLNLPSKRELSLKYELVADARVEGDFSLEGKFSYIYESEREEISVDPQNIHINPSDQVSADLIVDVMAFTGDFQGAEKAVVLPVAAYREAPYISPSSDGWIVNVLVSKGGISKLARVEEDIPGGYMAEAIETKDAIFSFKGGVAKFLWMTLPPEAYFLISYEIKSEGGSSDEAPGIKGMFSYMEDDNVKSIPIVQKDAAIGSMSDEEFVALISGSAPATKPVQKPLIVDKPAKKTKPAPKPVQPKAPVSEGIVFKVQVLASNIVINTDRYFAGKDIGRLEMEKHDGMYKYTSGSYKYYKDARSHITELMNAGLQDAFVTAYKDGRRIEVKEALRLSRQKWFE